MIIRILQRKRVVMSMFELFIYTTKFFGKLSKSFGYRGEIAEKKEVIEFTKKRGDNHGGNSF